VSTDESDWKWQSINSRDSKEANFESKVGKSMYLILILNFDPVNELDID